MFSFRLERIRDVDTISQKKKFGTSPRQSKNGKNETMLEALTAYKLYTEQLW